MSNLYKSEIKDIESKELDSWNTLRSFTSARVALGRTGTSVPLKEALDFRLAHAAARDAVYSTIDFEPLYEKLEQFGLPVITVTSKARNRKEYLQRPDLGRQLDPVSLQQLKSVYRSSCDIAIIIADGLSAKAVNVHAVNLLRSLIDDLKVDGYTFAPLVVAENARVALGDEAGECLKAKLTVMLIGERPGLSSSDSLGVYLTYAPSKELTDESRNCISNIREEGLQYETASKKIKFYIKEALRRKISGINLKETCVPSLSYG